MEGETEKRIRKLARNNCATFTGDNGCLLGDSVCLYFNGLCWQRCKWFEEAVLPADSVLQREYFNSLGIQRKTGEKDRCERCGTAIIRTSNRQKYCESCAEIRKRDRARESMRKARKYVG